MRGTHYIFEDSALADTLKRSGYEVEEVGNKWYSVYPNLNDGITMLAGVPVATLGTSAFSLLGFAGLSGIIAQLKEAMMRPETKVNHLEKIRKLMHDAIPLTSSGSHVRAGLQRNLEYVTDEVVALGYIPTDLDQKRVYKFRPITDGIAEPTLKGGPKMVDFSILGNLDEKVDEALEKKSLARLNEAYARLRVGDCKVTITAGIDREKLIDSMRNSLGHLAGQQAFAEPKDEPEDEPEDVTPGREYIEKARSYAGMEDRAAAAASMLTCYNNAAYEDHRTAADTIETMINALGYTVVRGFDLDDPAQIVLTQ